MKAIPVPLFVERHQKEVGPLQGFQQLLARLLPGDCPAQGCVDLREDCRLQEELLDGRRLPLENVLMHIVYNEAMTPTQCPDKGGGILVPAQGERSQLQSCHPAFGAAPEPHHLFLFKLQPHRLFEKAGGVFLTQTQIIVPDLDDLSARTPSGQCNRGINATGEQQVETGRKMIKQEDERLVDGLLFNHVIIIQDERHLEGYRGQLVDKQGQDRRECWWLWRLQQGQRWFTDLGKARAQRRQNTGLEACRVIVLFLQGEPGNVAGTLAGPGSEQRRFPKAGRSRE